MTAMDTALRDAYETLPPDAPAPRPDLLLGDAAGCRRRSARRPTRCTGTCAPPTSSSTARAARRRRRPAARALDAWEAELDRGRRAGRSANPVVGALVDAARRHDLPLDELRAYMRSMRVDCAPVRIATWEELCRYMDGSAGSVGRIMAPLLGVPPRTARTTGASARRSSSPNFIRDVGEDWRLDRIYLPGRGPRALRRARGATSRRGPPRRRCARWSTTRSAAPAACSPAPRPRRRARRPVRPGVRLACAVYEPRARPRRGRRLRRARPRARRARAAAAGPAVSGSLRGVTAGRTLRGAERTPLTASARTC